MTAIRERVELTSLRVVADELGMSPSGLHILLGGSRPRASTRRKVLEWYGEHRSRTASKRAGVPPEDVEAALSVLERYITADSRKTVQDRRVREVTQRLFGESSP